ncbi:unnamed protein product, partial [marine sediment metagenome]
MSLLKNIKEEMSVPIPEVRLPEGETKEKVEEEKSLLDDYKKIQKECGQWIKDLSKSSYYEK